MKRALFLAAILFPAWVQAQPIVGTPVAAAECAGGLRRDDGSFDDGWGFRSDNPKIKWGGYMQQFHLGGGDREVEWLCVCWVKRGSDSAIDFSFTFWGDGFYLPEFPDLLRVPMRATGVGSGFQWFKFDLRGRGVLLPRVDGYAGVSWQPNIDKDFYVCSTEGPYEPAKVWTAFSEKADGSNPAGGPMEDEGVGAIGLRLKLAEDSTPVSYPPGAPEPPGGAWLGSGTLPGYRVKVRLGGSTLGSPVKTCLDETICAAGAVADRAEVQVRVVGPKPNGYFWPTIVRFTTSRVEVWVERNATKQGRYYDIPAVSPDGDELPGLVDRLGFPK